MPDGTGKTPKYSQYYVGLSCYLNTIAYSSQMFRIHSQGLMEKGTDRIAGERRENRRYGLKLGLRWKVIRRRRLADSGEGFTLDLSRGGVRFYAGRDLPQGAKVALSISWPVLLHDIAPMLLAIDGKVIRSADGWVAVRSLQHEFRTQGVPRERHDGAANGKATNGSMIAASTAGERLYDRTGH